MNTSVIKLSEGKDFMNISVIKLSEGKDFMNISVIKLSNQTISLELSAGSYAM